MTHELIVAFGHEEENKIQVNMYWIDKNQTRKRKKYNCLSYNATILALV